MFERRSEIGMAGRAKPYGLRNIAKARLLSQSSAFARHGRQPSGRPRWLANTWRTDNKSEVRDRKDRPPASGMPSLKSDYDTGSARKRAQAEAKKDCQNTEYDRMPRDEPNQRRRRPPDSTEQHGERD